MDVELIVAEPRRKKVLDELFELRGAVMRVVQEACPTSASS